MLYDCFVIICSTDDYCSAIRGNYECDRKNAVGFKGRTQQDPEGQQLLFQIKKTAQYV
jgi:hypothetical protein